MIHQGGDSSFHVSKLLGGETTGNPFPVGASSNFDNIGILRMLFFAQGMPYLSVPQFFDKSALSPMGKRR